MTTDRRAGRIVSRVAGGVAFIASGLVLAGCTAPAIVQDERFTGSPKDFTLSIHACLLDAGWETELVTKDDGSVSLQAPGVTSADLREQFLEASDECNASMPAIPVPESDAELQQFYVTWTDVHSCLVDAGYDIDAPPSYQTFVDEYHAGNGSSDPYFLIADRTAREQARTVCPKNPDSWW